MSEHVYSSIVLVACSIGMVTTFTGHTFGFAFFLPHVEHALGINATVIGADWAIGLILSSFCMPFFGHAIDRYDVRVLAGGTALLFSLNIALMASIQSQLELCVGLFFLRLLGCGIINTAMMATFNRWFVRLRGKASIVFMCLSWMTMFLTAPVEILIRSMGWRATYRVIAIVVLFVFTCLCCIIRSSPQSVGLLPDWGLTLPDEISATHEEEVSYGVKAALRTSIFWSMLCALGVIEFVWAGVNLHIVHVLSATPAHLSTEQTAHVLTVVSISAILFSLGAGSTIDHIHNKHRLLAVAVFMGACALFALQNMDNYVYSIFFGVCLGGMAGITDICVTVAFADLFGNEYVGSILAVVNAFLTFMNGLAAIVFGLANDASCLGVAFQGLFIIAIPALLFVGSQRKPTRNGVAAKAFVCDLQSPFL